MSQILVKENAVAIVVNNAFVHYAKPLINSIKKNWPSHPVILLFLSPDVSAASATWFEQIPGVVIRRYDPNQFEYRKLLLTGTGKFDSAGFNDAGFFIVNFWNDSFSDYKNILILDADMLVLKDLTSLIESEEFIGISAANQRLIPAFSINLPLIKKLPKLVGSYIKALSMGVYPVPYVSLNSGVILIPAEDRSKEKYKALIDILKSFRDVCPTDQELILLWMSKYKKKVSNDFRMNYHARFFNGLIENSLPSRYQKEITKASADIYILHFNGPKPDTEEFGKHSWTRNQEQLKSLYNSYL